MGLESSRAVCLALAAPWDSPVASPSIAAAVAAGFGTIELVAAVAAAAVDFGVNGLAAVAVGPDAHELAAAGLDEPEPAVQHYTAAPEPSDETKTAIVALEEYAHEMPVLMPSIAGAAAGVPKERTRSGVY